MSKSKLETLLYLTFLFLSVNSFSYFLEKDSKPCKSKPTFTLRGYIKNAVTGLIIPGQILNSLNISITFSSLKPSRIFHAEIDYYSSIYTVTLPPGVYQRNGTLPTFVGPTTSVNITSNSTENEGANSIFFSPAFRGWRAVVTWRGSIDKDLDSYTKCADSSLVYYRNLDSKDRTVHFDVDSSDSGPETTEFSFDTSSKGTWSFFVSSYTKKAAMTKNEAKVAIYHGDQQVAEVNIPKTGANNAWYWHVFDLRVAGNVQSYVQINTLSLAMV